MELRGYLKRLEVVADSKFERLRHDLDLARGSRQAVTVFTAFTDKSHNLRSVAEIATFWLVSSTPQIGRVLSPKTPGRGKASLGTVTDAFRRNLLPDGSDRGGVAQRATRLAEALLLYPGDHLLYYGQPEATFQSNASWTPPERRRRRQVHYYLTTVRRCVTEAEAPTAVLPP